MEADEMAQAARNYELSRAQTQALGAVHCLMLQCPAAALHPAATAAHSLVRYCTPMPDVATEELQRVRRELRAACTVLTTELNRRKEAS